MHHHPTPPAQTPYKAACSTPIASALQAIDLDVNNNELPSALKKCNETLTLIALTIQDTNESRRYTEIVTAKTNTISRLAEVMKAKPAYSPTLTRNNNL